MRQAIVQHSAHSGVLPAPFPNPAPIPPPELSYIYHRRESFSLDKAARCILCSSAAHHLMQCSELHGNLRIPDLTNLLTQLKSLFSHSHATGQRRLTLLHHALPHCALRQRLGELVVAVLEGLAAGALLRAVHSELVDKQCMNLRDCFRRIDGAEPVRAGCLDGWRLDGAWVRGTVSEWL
jgi:hypothetical protein